MLPLLCYPSTLFRLLEFRPHLKGFLNPWAWGGAGGYWMSERWRCLVVCLARVKELISGQLRDFEKSNRVATQLSLGYLEFWLAIQGTP